MNVMFNNDFINKMWTVYQNVISQAALVDTKYPTAHHRYSAYNLLAFLAYKNNINDEFVRLLHMRGLQLSSIQHVVQSLHILCSHVGIIPSHNVSYTEDPDLLARTRRQDILGTMLHQDSPHLMLTLDAQMISSSVIEEYLLRGMTIARINCAYDDESTWLKLIETVRWAEDRLRILGHALPKCKIYMDLAGPKVRVRLFNTKVKPIKIGVKKNGYGKPTGAKQGILSWTAPLTKPLHNSDYDFQLSIQHQDKLKKLKEGDILTFLDIRNKKREFLITEMMPSGFVVRLDRTAYINENTRLENPEHQITLYVTNLEKRFLKLQVKKSDLLRIRLTNKREDDEGASAAIPCISVTLPEAFGHIEKGHSVFIDDGKIHGTVKEHNKEFVDLKIESPKEPVTIQDSKGINLPDSFVNLCVPALTNKDEKDLAFVCRHADMVGLSFVNDPADLQKLKQSLSNFGRTDIPVIAKIETKQAVKHFSKILIEGLKLPKFGVMVARGDLAIEIGFKELSVVQEEILSMCRASHTPVILGTQVLDTLAKKGSPSRSELADVYFGSEFDCVMLNKGPFIKETLEFINETLFLISQSKSHKITITRPNEFTFEYGKRV